MEPTCVGRRLDQWLKTAAATSVTSSAIDKSKTVGHLDGMSRVSLKEQIVEAAVDTLHKKGFNASSVQDITDAAHAPKGSFYNHFDSKEALAVEAIDRYWRNILHPLGALSDESAPALTRLTRYFDRLSNVARDREYQTGCLIGNLSAEMPDQSRPVRERLAVVLAAWSRAIESCVRDAQVEGSIRSDLDAKTIAAFLLNSWQGAVMRAKVDRDPTAFEAFSRVVFAGLTK